MFRVTTHVILAGLAVTAVAGCVTETSETSETAETSETSALTAPAPATALPAFTREHVTADIWHYEASIRVGSAPNSILRVHRVVRELAPFQPRPAVHAAMLLHGDFATFVTNFAPTLGDPASPALGLAPYLAAQNIDVWGVDRRWTIPDTDGDISDFGAMGLAQELGDVRAALALARAVRAATGSGGGPLALVGFSHGAELAYTYAAVEGGEPAALRNANALVALDFYGAYGADEADLQAQACANADAEYQAVAAGETDSPNGFLISAGQLALSDPDGDSGYGMTNRQLALAIVGQTYELAPIAPLYHLLAPVLDSAGDVVALRKTSETAADDWLAAAPPHESELEAADFDAQLCGAAPPVAAPLSQIRIPLDYIGAAGGVGALGLDATRLVASTDVTTSVVALFPPDQVASDYGHGDLLYAPASRALVWQPLAAWLARH